MIDVLISVVCLALGYYVGYNQAKLKDQLQSLKVKEPEPAVTRDDPRLINENYQSQGEVGIASPKSPQLLEWEANQELLKKNENYRIKPE